MKKKILKTRFLLNLLLLPSGLFLAAFIALLLVFIESTLFKKASLSDQLIPDIFGGAFGLILGAISFLLFIFWWSKRIFNDIIRFKKLKPFVFFSLVLLLIPYSPVIGFGFHTLSTEIKYYYQRKEISHEVDSYAMLKPENVRRIICTITENDSLFLVTSALDFRISNSDESIRLNGKHIYSRELQLFSVGNNRLVKPANFMIDTVRVNGQLHWNIPEAPIQACNILAHKNNKIFLDSNCHHFTGVIEGFEKKSRKNGPNNGKNYLAEDDTFWHLFYSEEKGEKLTQLNLAEFTPTDQRVHVIHLLEGDEQMFDSDQIISLFRTKGKFYIIADTAILVFEL